jgi:hypothetical protein
MPVLKAAPANGWAIGSAVKAISPVNAVYYYRRRRYRRYRRYRRCRVEGIEVNLGRGRRRYGERSKSSARANPNVKFIKPGCSQPQQKQYSDCPYRFFRQHTPAFITECFAQFFN